MINEEWIDDKQMERRKDDKGWMNGWRKEWMIIKR